MRETIHIFHTNDLHSHFEYWPRMQSYIRKQRLLLGEKGEASFLFDLGDHLDRSNLYTEATVGKGNVQMLVDAEYDVVTIGNNEGITLEFKELYHLYDRVPFDVVVANLYAKSGDNPAWLKPYTVLETAHGTTIGVVGATAAFETFYHALNWDITDARTAIMQQVEQLKGKVDIIVVMSHLGINDDELLANDCPHIDVIFGSHTHHVLPEGKWVNGVLLTGGGKFGRYTGHLTLEFDHTLKALVRREERLIENEQLPAVHDEAEQLYALTKQAKSILSQEKIYINKTYTKEWFHDSPLAKLFAEAILAETGADCAMFNAGIFLKDLRRGNVSRLEMHEIFPHPINLCVIELSGAELKEIYKQAQNEEWPNLQLNGLGFRGIVFGKMLFYRMQQQHYEFKINNEPLVADKTYRLVTLDLFTFGYFFPSFKYAKKEYYLPNFIRDIMLLYLERNIEGIY